MMVGLRWSGFVVAALMAFPAAAQICGGTAAATCFANRCVGCHATTPAPAPITTTANATLASEILAWGAFWPRGNLYAFRKNPTSMGGLTAATGTELDALAAFLGGRRNDAGNLNTPVIATAALDFAPSAPGDTVATTVDVSHTASVAWSLLVLPRTSGSGFSASVVNAGTAANSACLQIDRVIDGVTQTWYAVAPGAFCRVRAGYTRPAAPTTGLVAATGTLTIEHNTVAGSTAIVLNAPPLVPALAPETINFGNQTAGGIYPARPLVLTNNGSAALAIASIVTSGAGFSSTHDCPATLAAGAACTVTVSFVAAAAATDYTGQVAVSTDAAGSPRTVALSGRGTAATVPVLAWAPLAGLAFGDQAAGTRSVSQAVTVTNQGPGGATIASVDLAGANATEFTTSGTCASGALLFAGQSCQIDVVFAPVAAGAKQASLQLGSSGSGVAPIGLSGNGLPGLAPGLQVAGAPLAFGVLDVGSASLAQELVLRSSAATTLNIVSLTLAGPFELRPGTCAAPPLALPPGSECRLAIAFVPSTAGPATGALTIASDAPDSPTMLALSGTGSAPPGPARDLVGGCSIGGGQGRFDPLWWLLVGLAAALLSRRPRNDG